MFELAYKEQINNLLDNKVLVSLIKDKRYDIDKNTWIELEGELSFTLSFANERLVLTMDNIKPKLTARRFLKFQGRVSSILIGRENLIISLDGLPDQTIPLTKE